MHFPFNVYSISFATAFLITAGSMRFWRSISTHLGLVDDPGHRKLHSGQVPLAGGLALAAGIGLPILCSGLIFLVEAPLARLIDFSSLRFEQFGWQQLEYGLSRRIWQLAAILGGALLMLLVGLWDDRRELSPGLKFCGQLLAAFVVAASGLRITLFVESVPFSYVVTVLWILTLTNAFNFIDNMNGLCGGLGLIAAWAFGWSAAVQGQYLVALLAWLVCGALLGFLLYNFPNATVFLGDGGSHLTGYLLAILAILPSFYTRANLEVWAVGKPLLILAVPLLDLVQVVIHRWRIGQAFYIGDTNHFSHRLVKLGLPKPAAVLLLWLAGALFGWIALLTWL